MAGKLSGKASYFSYNGTRININKYTPKITRDLADLTDSADYDSGDDVVYQSQVAVKVGMELSVEGKFNVGVTDAVLMAALFSGVAAQPVVLGLDAGTLYGHGNFDISDFESDIVTLEECTYKCTMKLNGKFHPGS